MTDLHHSIPRLLMIEDDADTASLVADILADHFGGRCIEHVSTLDALGNVDLEPYDLALCDYNLPDGTALEAIAAIKARRPSLPVIVVTAQSDIDTLLETIRSGAADYLLKSSEVFATIPIAVEKNLTLARMQRENERLQAALSESLREITHKNDELQQLVQRLEEAATTDPLTRLANRRRLSDRLEQMHAEAVRYGTDLACILFDLDGFKAINDELGHQAGDELLSQIGAIIRSEVRSSDLAARFGGDEFVILMPHTTCDTAVNLADRIMKQFVSVCPIDGAEPTPSACGMSVGVASLRTSRPRTGEELIHHADVAMYTAKHAGRRCIRVCDADGRNAHPPRNLAA
ncbi:MAG: GGDEF domain-containing response regulator [Phycisphaerales bacterium]